MRAGAGLLFQDVDMCDTRLLTYACAPLSRFLLLELQDHLPKRGRPHCPSPRNCNGSMGFLVQDLGEEQARTTHTRGGGCIH